MEEFKNFEKVLRDLENKEIPDSYWEKEEKIIEKSIRENEKISKSIEMNPEKFKQCFSL